MEWNSKSYNETLTQYKSGKAALSEVSIDIVGDVNNLSPVTLLRAYEMEPTVDNMLGLTAEMIINRVVQFKRGSKVLYSFTYNGGDIGEQFKGSPAYLDLLLKTCYGIMLKKLTPPSDDFESEENL